MVSSAPITVRAKVHVEQVKSGVASAAKVVTEIPTKVATRASFQEKTLRKCVNAEEN